MQVAGVESSYMSSFPPSHPPPFLVEIQLTVIIIQLNLNITKSVESAIYSVTLKFLYIKIWHSEYSNIYELANFRAGEMCKL